MRIGYLDCFSGISGDMCLGALIDAGVDFEAWKEELTKLPVQGYRLNLKRIKRSGIAAVSIDVEVDERQPERHLADITQIIEDSSLPEQVRQSSKAVFQNLAHAEAKVHGTTPDHIHFHEVGAVDAIIDVVGTALGLYMLNIDKLFVSPLPLGRGFINCMHGIIPSPAPATLELLVDKGIPVYGTDLDLELVTPTGTAIAATLGEGSVIIPSMLIDRIGYGAGKKEYHRPNLLRLIIGQASDNQNKSSSCSIKQIKKQHNHHHNHHQHGGR